MPFILDLFCILPLLITIFLSEAFVTLTGLQNQMTEDLHLVKLSLLVLTPIMLCDNSSAVQLAHNPVLHAKIKYMELDVFFVQEKVFTKQLVI